jgi:hypothetical protein
MSERRWRHTAAVHLALFFLAVAAAPHHHLNGIEDILLDQPSASNCVTQVLGPAAASGTWDLNPIRVVADEWCVACFTSDFVSSPPASFSFVMRPVPLPLQPAVPATAIPKLVPADPSSRAPPRVS